VYAYLCVFIQKQPSNKLAIQSTHWTYNYSQNSGVNLFWKLGGLQERPSTAIKFL